MRNEKVDRFNDLNINYSIFMIKKLLNRYYFIGGEVQNFDFVIKSDYNFSLIFMI